MIQWMFLVLALWIVPSASIVCYKCSNSESTSSCTTTETVSIDTVHCVIRRENEGQDIFISYGHINTNTSSFIYRGYPYLLVREAITYSETSGKWNTQADRVTYGCNWDWCNAPSLLPYLPTDFQMRLSDTWLNSTVLGSGESLQECNQCPDEAVCGPVGSINVGNCSTESCNNTCAVSQVFNGPIGSEQCYQSFCIEADDGDSTGTDKPRVEIEAILYASNTTNVELREVDLYCRGESCSRPETFIEIGNGLTLQTGDLTVLFNQTAQEPVIRCFSCDCETAEDCTCDNIASAIAKSTYCSITVNYASNGSSITYSPTDKSQYPNILEFPYVIVDETILYNNQTGRWVTNTNKVVYGCNWDYCNKASLASLLPATLQMRLSESWLNSSVLGTGNPVHQCNECEDAPICSLNRTVDSLLCPTGSCDTTCFVTNTYNNTATNEQCYQSFCVPEDSDLLEYNKYRVEIVGAVYPSQVSRVQLRKVSIYCRVDNCSRPEIFQEVENALTFNQGNISLLLNQTSIGEPNQLRCYDAYCMNNANCVYNSTASQPINSTYCTVIREYDGQNFWIILEHIDRNSTLVYINEFPFLLLEESIIYNEDTGRWITRPSLIVYGCDTDFCNDPRLVPFLPISFQMRLSETWLNTSVLGTGQPVRECHECADAPQCGTTDFLDATRCPIRSCNTTCFVSDTFNDPSQDLLCYQSYCLPEDSDDLEIDRHRVEIEGIIYGNRPNAQLELWEVDIFCRADDCSRPEIFKELQAELTVYTGDLSAFFNITTIEITTTTTAPPVASTLSCYNCACYNDPTCSCTTVQVEDAGSSYCSIVRVNYESGSFTIDLEHIDRNSTRVYIRKFPFLLAEESILYNETTQQWSTRSNILVYGCNWHLCNHPSLVTLIPDSFKMTLSDEWLNNNILDKNASVRDCHQCPDAPQCGTTSFLDSSRCPVRACNNTCVVSDLFDDPSSDLLCYQSYCSSVEDDWEENQHRVELEGIIYGDQLDVVELWEIDLYCRADDCSRPEIFDEVRQNLTVETNNLTTILTNESTSTLKPQRICYDCFCYDDPNCDCSRYTVADADTTYCTIVRFNYGNDFTIDLQHINRNSTRVYIREFPYLLVEESIIYRNETISWNTTTNLVVYGCNTDFCNHPRFIPYLPNTFQMTLGTTWLNENVLGTGKPVRNCHVCSNGSVCTTTGFIDGNLCPITPCNTTCLVSELYNDPDGNDECYDSYCAPPDSATFNINPHRVELEGILYLYPIGRQVELWEIEIYCRADDCSRPSVFNETRNQLTVTIGSLDYFYNITTTSTSRPTTTSSRSTTSTTRTTTTARVQPTSSTTRNTTTTRSQSTASTTTFGQTTVTTRISTPSSAPAYLANCVVLLLLVLLSILSILN